MGKGLGPEEQREDIVYQHTYKECSRNKGEGDAALCTHGTGNALHVKRVAADGTNWQQSLGNRLEAVVPPAGCKHRCETGSVTHMWAKPCQ